MILRDDIAHHRKFLVAGEILGGISGSARALAIWVAAIGYARRFHTDGFVDRDYVRDKCVTLGGDKVANVLCSRRVRLLHRVKGGYIVHDFAQYNGTNDKLQRQRELAAARKRKQRAKQAVENLCVTCDVTRDRVRDSRARAIEKEKEKEIQEREQRPGGRETSGLALSEQQTHDLARQPAADENFAVLVKLTHTVMDSEGNTDATSPDLIEAVKCAAATQGIRYQHQVFNRALRSADAQRRITTGPLSPMVEVMRTALTNQTLPQTVRTFARGRR